MTEVCLCIKIHIPAVISNYRFKDINLQHQYYDDAQIKEQTLSFYTFTLKPFFEFIRYLSDSTEQTFHTGITISGISMSLFKRYVPHFIDTLYEFSQENIIEFLSGSWSNSYLAFEHNKLMIRQIILHDLWMNSLFGVIPQVFIAPVPVVSDDIFSTICSLGKKQVFTYSNHIDGHNGSQKRLNEPDFSDDYREWLINYKAGQVLQGISCQPEIKEINSAASSCCKKILKHLNGCSPPIILCNLGEKNNHSHAGDTILLHKVFTELINECGVRFVHPSELDKTDVMNNTSDNVTGQMINSCKLPDLWLRNNLQKDAYSRLQEINEMIGPGQTDSMISEWDQLQDMEYLYYMNSQFSDPKYSATHFSPYSSPYLAYTNYLNVLDDFKQRIIRSGC